MQRFCLTLTMHSDDATIDAYADRHRSVPPAILQSQRDAGVIRMDIFRDGPRMIMLMETTDDFTFERKAAMDRNNPAVMQWEAEMAKYQGAGAYADASGKWLPLPQIFNLTDQLAAMDAVATPSSF